MIPYLDEQFDRGSRTNLAAIFTRMANIMYPEPDPEAEQPPENAEADAPEIE